MEIETDTTDAIFMGFELYLMPHIMTSLQGLVSSFQKISTVHNDTDIVTPTLSLCQVSDRKTSN
uniref:AlNc14C375G11165 protein n=1 Tax=Albugo laibachii Nc14 TaxID=890382 RepID=F0WYA6_9STRA|nr:AlNc14C375G11165 [Albugo laibachii Nc14]|eukprot:CCA26458.1 AlNc14C375G11165 [Albugo laibachii Nc14]